MRIIEYGANELSCLSRKDKKLAKLIERTGHLEREVNKNLFHSLVDYIATQQISNKAARTVQTRIYEKFGIVTAKKMALKSDEEIKSVGISMRKVSYIRCLCQAAISGELEVEQLDSLSNEIVVSKLTSIKGIGDWTAEMFLIFSLERMDIVSYKDFAIRKGMMALYGLKELDRQTFDRYRERYSPYGTVASLYLWHLSKEVK